MPLQLVEMAEGFSCYASGSFEARFIYQEIFQDDNYHQPELPGEPFLVDVGANIGLFSLYMKQQRPGARIAAFEPAPENLEALRRNLDLHEVSGVTVHPYGLGSVDHDAQLVYYPQMPGNSTFFPDEKALQKSMMGERLGQDTTAELFSAVEVTVPVRRLSDLLARYHPGTAHIDLLKIDVEGAELDVLEGIDDGDWARTQRVLLEVTDTDGALAQVTDLLRSHGLTVTSEPVPFMWEELRFRYVTAHR